MALARGINRLASALRRAAGPRLTKWARDLPPDPMALFKAFSTQVPVPSDASLTRGKAPTESREIEDDPAFLRGRLLTRGNVERFLTAAVTPRG
jgi:hypothetical protein